MKKIICSVAIAGTLVSGCTSINPTTGKEETNTLQTVGLGAGIGAAVGALVGGKTGALVGATLGGGVGYLAALESRKKELEEAQAAAKSFEKDTGFKPVVHTATYKQQGSTVTGLKEIEIPIPAAAVSEKKGQGLTPKGKAVVEKLQTLGDQQGGLELQVPASTKQAVVAELAKTAPRAKIVIAGDSKIVAKISPKPLTESGMTVI